MKEHFELKVRCASFDFRIGQALLGQSQGDG